MVIKYRKDKQMPWHLIPTLKGDKGEKGDIGSYLVVLYYALLPETAVVGDIALVINDDSEHQVGMYYYYKSGMGTGRWRYMSPPPLAYSYYSYIAIMPQAVSAPIGTTALVFEDGAKNGMYYKKSAGVWVKFGGEITVPTYADLPAGVEGNRAVVLTDITATFEPAEFVAGEDVDLFLNPYPIVDKVFNAEMTVPDEGYDDDSVIFTADTVEHALKAEFSVTDEGTTSDIAFVCSENSWHKITTIAGVVTEDLAISYRDVPTFEGAFTSESSLTNAGYYLSEEFFRICKAGIYYFNGIEWERDDTDSSMHCENTGLAGTASGYGTTNSGDAGTANGVGTSNTGLAGTANGVGTSNTGDVGTANGIGTSNTGLAGTANGVGTSNTGDAGTANGIGTSNTGLAGTANGVETSNTGGAGTANGYRTHNVAEAGFIVGQYGRNSNGSLFSVANGEEGEGNESLAVDITVSQAIFNVPIIGKHKSENDKLGITLNQSFKDADGNPKTMVIENGLIVSIY